jgi:hypothetical protein
VVYDDDPDLDPLRRRNAPPWGAGVPPGPVDHRAMRRMRFALLGAVAVLAVAVVVGALLAAIG